MKALFKTLLTVLLVLQAAMVHGLPAGVHLNFCFGADGHFELSHEPCTGSAEAACGPAAATAIREGHHDDCLDFATGCGQSGRLFHCSAKLRLANGTDPSADDPPLPTPSLSASVLPVPRDLFQSRLLPATCGRQYPVPLHALRSTVLLI